MTLRIPDVTGMDTLSAALAYAAADWYVIPVRHDTKAPTVVGKGWHHQSSRDPEQIVAWFAGTDHAIGLHVGRSGAVVFDVDEPDMTPDVIWEAVAEEAPPYQSTRVDVPNRGHFVFAVPPGRTLGNSRGALVHPEHGKKWGEVRGANGIIVAEPSVHVKPGGRYRWIRDEGSTDFEDVPVLPESIACLLPDASPSLDAAADDVVNGFLVAHAEGTAAALRPILDRFATALGSGSRHEALVEYLAWAMRDAAAGKVNAMTANDTMRQMFLEAMGTERVQGRFPTSEYQGVLAWAVGQALAIDPVKRAAQIEARLNPEPDDFTTLTEPAKPVPSSATALQPAPGKLRDSSDYFPNSAITHKPDLDAVLLANDVLLMGPLAVARDHRFWSYADGVWREDQHAVRGRSQQCLRRYWRPNHATIAAQMLAHHPDVLRLDGDPTPDLINFQNGMLRWRTGDLLDHDPSYRSTIQLPYAYEPDGGCPLFEQWLGEILSPDYVELAWQMIGYLLMSGNPLQTAFLFLGRGRNGKGTLMRVLGKLLGGDNYSAISLDDLTGNRFAAAGLYGKTANLAGDIDATFQESTARFKMLTGEDKFTAENKGQDSFRFECWAVPIFSANKIFGSADTSEGYLRRWIIMKFERTFSDDQKIMNLDRRFDAELPGIAAKAIGHLQKLMADGHFKNDGEIAAGKAEFAEHLDQVRQWVDQCCEADEGSEERSMLYASYKVWAQVNGAGLLKASEFYHRLDSAGYDAIKVHGQRRHRGLRVKQLRMQGDVYAEQT